MSKSKADELVTTDEPELPALLNDLNGPAPIAKVIELRNKGLSYTEVGAILGVTKEAIYQRLKPFLPSVDNLQAVKDNRADTLTVVGDSVLTSLTEEDIQKASAYQKVGMAGLLHNMERLERDKSTANIAHVYKGLTVKMDDLQKQIAENQAQLGMMPEEGEHEDA